MSKIWKEYHEKTKNSPPSTLLVKALGFVTENRNALDFGCGALRDASLLLSRFENVTFLDKTEPLKEVLDKFSKESNFNFLNKSFEEYNFPKDHFDLVSAQYSLPFISKDKFNKIWKNLVNSLKKNGVFTGQFFGVEDEWNKGEAAQRLNFHTKEDLSNLLKDLDVLLVDEEKKMGKTAKGQDKHWHVFHVIARKP